MINDCKLKIFIKNFTKIISKRLNLTIPKIDFSEYYNIGYSQFDNSINISLKVLRREYKNWNRDLCPLEITNYLDRIYFIIAHEVAHHFQHCKFPEWFRKYRKQKWDIGWKTNKEYASLKLEKNATKIACILSKEKKNE